LLLAVGEGLIWFRQNRDSLFLLVVVWCLWCGVLRLFCDSFSCLWWLDLSGGGASAICVLCRVWC
jgi:hypothetical protein